MRGRQGWFYVSSDHFLSSCERAGSAPVGGWRTSRRDIGPPPSGLSVVHMPLEVSRPQPPAECEGGLEGCHCDGGRELLLSGVNY